MAPRFALATKRAKAVLAELGIQSPPVQLEVVAKHLGLVIAAKRLDSDISGMVMRSATGGVVGVNLSHHKNRRRFTIAHEIGHFLLHHEEDTHVDRTLPVSVSFRDARSGTASDDREIEANQFAAELLMPEDWLVQDLKHLEGSTDYEDETWIRGLAEKYQVSMQAMTIRLSRFGFR